jgi:hypothetical protein
MVGSNGGRKFGSGGILSGSRGGFFWRPFTQFERVSKDLYYKPAKENC